MPDTLGWRAKFGVVGPSTNTVVEADFASMRVPGVTVQYSRILLRDPRQDSDEKFEDVLEQMRREIDAAVDSVMTAEPDYLILGMSAETFWGGRAGNRELNQRLRSRTGLDVATGAEALERGLKTLGVGRIGLVTPYQPIGDRNVVQFFRDIGVEVVAVEGLRCPTTVSIAQVSEASLREALRKVNVARVEALVQVGTNLSMIRLADEAERWLDKPVIAVNAAIWWMALRAYGISDRLDGFGSLLREY